MGKVTELLDNERRGMTLHVQQLRDRREKSAQQLKEIDAELAVAEKELSEFEEDMKALPVRLKPLTVEELQVAEVERARI